MNVTDIIFDSYVPMHIKTAILDVMATSENWNSDLMVLMPTDSNDDVNGGQHASNGGNDFTYRDVTVDDVIAASSIGYYDYFSGYYGGYTGHYYQGDGSHFPAIVIDPPTYAVIVSV